MGSRRYRAKIAAFCFILPALLVALLLLLYPVISSVFYSFTSKHLIKADYDFVGLKNYIDVLTDADFWRSFFTNIKWTVASLAGQILVGFTAALALERIKHWRSFYRTILIIPWAFPSIVIALSWKWILNGVSGFLPNFLVNIGLFEQAPPVSQQWSAGPFPPWYLSTFGSARPSSWSTCSLPFRRVPKDQYEAAQLDGASPLQSFIHITIPHIRVVVGLLVVLRTIWIFNSFDMIYLITGGGACRADGDGAHLCL